jgi:putative endonuclease
VGELLARQFLTSKGYQIIQSNFRIRGGEIDLIATFENQLIFFEIKTRSLSTYSDIFSAPEQISLRQQRQIRQTARHFLFQNRQSSLPSDLQFDLLVIHWDSVGHSTQAKIKHLKNIFSE